MKNIFQKFKKSNFSYSLNDIIHAIEQVRLNNDVINLSAENTGSSWLGVKNAGLSLFPKCTVTIPQYYSNQVISDQDLKTIGDKIGGLNFEQLIFNGFNTYFRIIIKSAKESNKKLRVGQIHHGFFGELTDSSIMREIFSSILDSYDEGLIDKIAFAKQGNAEILKKIRKIDAFHLLYKNQISTNPSLQKTIGVMTNDAFRKNTYTQVVAAQSINNFETVVISNSDFSMFEKDKKVIRHPHLDHSKFLKLMGQNYINSHVTFSEASGGQVFTESLALGVPCLTSLTHGYLNDSEELQKALVVERFDDSWAIAQKMEEVIANRDYISKIGLIYSEQMNQKSNELLKKFLEA